LFLRQIWFLVVYNAQHSAKYVSDASTVPADAPNLKDALTVVRAPLLDASLDVIALINARSIRGKEVSNLCRFVLVVLDGFAQIGHFLVEGFGGGRLGRTGEGPAR
jgi:hypothetical protein